MNKLNDQELMILARIADPHCSPVKVGNLSGCLPYSPEYLAATVAKLAALGFVRLEGERYSVPGDRFDELCDALDRFSLPLRYGSMYCLPTLGQTTRRTKFLQECFVPVSDPTLPIGTFRYVGPDEGAPPKYPRGRALRASVAE